MKKIIFICTGNICRSPTAEAILRDKIIRQNLTTKISTDSAAIYGFHSGESPDARSVKMGQKRNISFEGIYSRQVTHEDFEKFDLILAMDKGHEAMLLSMSPNGKDKIKLFLDYAFNKPQEVKDPYYGGEQGFEEVFNLIDQGVDAIIKRILDKH